MSNEIASVVYFIEAVKDAISAWHPRTSPWFRGEPDVEDTPLLPSLYRPTSDGGMLIENRLVQSFRRMGPAFSHYSTPDKHAIDEWLFLMQHLRVPTRLLDWTEGALIGLYFALDYEKPVVWVLDPDGLNRLSTNADFSPGAYPLTWFRPTDGTVNIGHENIRGAWEKDEKGVDLPVAIKPTYIHPRMSAQKSCFTVHGKKKRPLSELVPDSILVKMVIDPREIGHIRRELAILGVTHTTVFPEAEYLARELKETAISEAISKSDQGA
jgi:hypothetical protein